MLAFPSAFASIGIVPGVISCLSPSRLEPLALHAAAQLTHKSGVDDDAGAFSGFTAFSGLYLLSLCAAKVQPARKASFNAVSSRFRLSPSFSRVAVRVADRPLSLFQCVQVSMMTFGKGATVFFDLAIAIKVSPSSNQTNPPVQSLTSSLSPSQCFGVSISYLIIIKTLTPSAVTTIFSIIAPSTQVPSLLKSGPFWLLVSMLANVPLSFFKRLDSLRFTSQAALVFVLYMLSIVVVYYFHRPHDIEPAGPIKYFRWSHSAIGSFP